jgi:hypothetical protein
LGPFTSAGMPLSVMTTSSAIIVAAVLKST